MLLLSSAVADVVVVVVALVACVDFVSAEPGIAGLHNCGGGPFSSFFANLVSIPCHVEEIDACCHEHDHCYDAPLLQETCDARFCACLEAIPTNLYCRTLAQPGLCLATKVFGHNFHWSTTCSPYEDDGDSWWFSFLSSGGSSGGDGEEDENSTEHGHCAILRNSPDLMKDSL